MKGYSETATAATLHFARGAETSDTQVGRSLRFTQESIDLYLKERTTKTWTPHGHEEE